MIAAIATAPGHGGVGIVRLSGSGCLVLAEKITGKMPNPRVATFSNFKDEDGNVIDSGLVLYFPNPHSFTGEEVVELQGHGGPVVMQMLLARCVDLGARLAAPGEFTQRAFLNGKLDLAQAEAVADLINASTSAAARSAVRSLQGEFSRTIAVLVDELINLRMLVEATLDFPDEEIDFLQAANAFARVEKLQQQLSAVFQKARQGKLLQAGVQVVLIGQPNVGKSSLLNRLAGDDLAIVTPVAGTTRDVLRSNIQLGGIPLHIIDTAGLRHTEDEVEKIGIERTWKEIAKADIALVLVDARAGLTPDDEAICAQLPEDLQVIFVRNKADLFLEGETLPNPLSQFGSEKTVITVSAKTGWGLAELEAELLRRVGWQDSEDVFMARERHLRALSQAQDHLNQAYALLNSQCPPLEFFAEELRLCHFALGEITGEFTADDLLGVIFSRFCIGK